MKTRVLLGIATMALVTTAVIAQTDPIATRRTLMKGNGQAAKLGGQMVKGEVPFDLAKAQEIYKNFDTAAAAFPNLFPDDSKTGGETTASPKIWEDMADFRARFASWDQDVKKAATDTHDLDSFKANFATLTKACGSCHQVYRVKT